MLNASDGVWLCLGSSPAVLALAVITRLLPPTDMDSVNNRLSCAFQSKLEL